MKKTNNKQPVTAQQVKAGKPVNNTSMPADRKRGGKEVFHDINLDQPAKKNQRNDAAAGTVENGIG